KNSSLFSRILRIRSRSAWLWLLVISRLPERLRAVSGEGHSAVFTTHFSRCLCPTLHFVRMRKLSSRYPDHPRHRLDPLCGWVAGTEDTGGSSCRSIGKLRLLHVWSCVLNFAMRP